jgi:Fur family ferric uptake transcriptional regulator
MKISPVQQIQSSGYKLTHQRQLILSLLEESDQHLGADELFHLAKHRDPKISLATVYRTLATFKKIGLIQEHALGQDHGHFEKVSSKPHFHFTCSQCGQVIELRSKKISRLIKELCEDEDIFMESMHLLINGLCSTCNSKIKTSS